jgi:CheY-like chemotaxis protein
MKIADASIMIVDDEPDLVEIFTAWLEGASCKRVVPADCGKTALTLLKSTRVDLLVTDINMPGIDGITLIRNIAKSGVRMPVIIVLSGQNYNETELRQKGIRAILRKPVRRTEFLAVIEDALSIGAERDSIGYPNQLEQSTIPPSA